MACSHVEQNQDSWVVSPQVECIQVINLRFSPGPVLVLSKYKSKQMVCSLKQNNASHLVCSTQLVRCTAW